MEESDLTNVVLALFDWFESSDCRQSLSDPSKAMWSYVALAVSRKSDINWVAADLEEKVGETDTTDPSYDLSYHSRLDPLPVEAKAYQDGAWEEGENVELGPDDCDDSGESASEGEDDDAEGEDEGDTEAMELCGMPEEWVGSDPAPKCRLEFPVLPVWKGLAAAMQNNEQEQGVDEQAGEGLAGEPPDTEAAQAETRTGDNSAMVVEPEAAVFLTGVLEYLAAEVLELGGNSTLDNKRHKRCMQAADIKEAMDKDEELCALCSKLPPLTPAHCAVLPGLLIGGGPLLLDVYWRAENRFPGGNCDAFNIRYRFEMERASDGDGSPDEVRVALLDYHRCWDGTHYVGGGDVLAALRGRMGARSVYTEVSVALTSLVRSGACSKDGASLHYVADLTTKDSNSYDTEWSSVEVVVFDSRSEEPILRAEQKCLLGPQYRPSTLPEHVYDKLLSQRTAQQTAVTSLFTELVGMGRPEEFSDCKCPVSREDVPSVSASELNYGGAPCVLPRYLRQPRPRPYGDLA